ncbi:MAG: glycosyltransferase [Enterocloster aldenensis]|nr:glycosyltransferase [Enterocloster aldenensis]MDY4529401.1 glycosyltransferase family 2 protein [Enterocloster aldenensis]
MENIQVSIVMPVFNSNKYLSEAIESVLQQTFTSWELIIVDDHSTDGSINIIKKYAHEDSRIIPIFLPKNVGAAAARNTGIACRRGRYLAFLDSDDIWLKQKLEIQLSFMKTNNYSFSYTSYNLISQSGKKMNREVSVPPRISYKDALTKTAISTITVCLDMKQITSISMPLLKGAEDTGTWLSLLKHIDYAYGIDMILASYRQVPTSLSHNPYERIMRNWRLYRQIEGFSVIKSFSLYIRYALYVLSKRKRSRK